MKSLMTTLSLLAAAFVALLVGGTASASTNAIWADSVSSASTIAESAKAHINRSHDCQGLDKLLELGPSASGGSPSDALGDLRSELLELDVLAATVRFATIEASDASAREATEDALSQINWSRADVTRTLVTRLRYCGNGVEKGPSK